MTGSLALRISTAKNGWTLHQMRVLLILWSTDLFATCIAERIGRSASSVRYKARAMGLPARDRCKLTRDLPDLLHGLLPPEHKTWSTEDERQFGEEHLRGVRTAATAIRLRRGAVQCNNSIIRLMLPRRHELRGQLKDEYNPEEPYLEAFRHQGWHFRQCAASPNMIWTTRNGPRISNAFKKTKAYRDLYGSAAETSAGGY